MEEKKETENTTPTSTDTTPQVNLMDKEPVVASVEGTPAPTASAAVVAPTKKPTSWKLIVITLLLVAVALLAVVYVLEKEGRLNTTLFSGIIAEQEANKPVAVINGEVLTAEDLDASIEQLSLSATAQGANPNDPEIRAEIESQAFELLINAELLKQAAVAQGITVSEEELAARIQELEESAGGAEAFQARLAEFEVSEAQLQSDVSEELSIQALLDSVFADTVVPATEAEVQEVYDNALAASGGQALPPLEDVRAQIEQQILQTREAEQVEIYLQTLRADADIELNQ